MKPRALVLLSGTLTLGFGYWLAEHSRDNREIWFSVGAWILGFWFASRLLANSAQVQESGDFEDDQEADEDADEDPGDEEEYEQDSR